METKDEIRLIPISSEPKPIPEVPTISEVPVVPVKGKLCLNMIVKNESKIITRLLSSVVDLIDTIHNVFDVYGYY